jgi:hypothetical protein
VPVVWAAVCVSAARGGVAVAAGLQRLLAVVFRSRCRLLKMAAFVFWARLLPPPSRMSLEIGVAVISRGAAKGAAKPCYKADVCLVGFGTVAVASTSG